MGHPDDENDALSLHEQIAAAQEPHVYHDPIDVPPEESPFSNPTIEQIFLQSLEDVVSHHVIPEGYGVAEGEWGVDGYAEVELLRCGRGERYLEVVLPFSVWWPRAVAWAQALDLMNRVLTVHGTSDDSE